MFDTEPGLSHQIWQIFMQGRVGAVARCLHKEGDKLPITEELLLITACGKDPQGCLSFLFYARPQQTAASISARVVQLAMMYGASPDVIEMLLTNCRRHVQFSEVTLGIMRTSVPNITESVRQTLKWKPDALPATEEALEVLASCLDAATLQSFLEARGAALRISQKSFNETSSREETFLTVVKWVFENSVNTHIQFTSETALHCYDRVGCSDFVAQHWPERLKLDDTGSLGIVQMDPVKSENGCETRVQGRPPSEGRDDIKPEI
ncbi:uncharacterized protein F5Z01DRAFT_639115 [Emericellopsis atlantica]|uniref:Uncharacterized protein n=1 Tax=Emericellopsis atlantica TaxID=2614577 RepID=A0A9P7ZHD5_9HYPO|nr:uncharacterized protein F5Z01DRAFT_639115 [Emericellopsis atlantica]KAG9251508.1 hypothetical protein F5Z01DRAFT_639115 [Emericellopsis atlantica]